MGIKYAELEIQTIAVTVFHPPLRSGDPDNRFIFEPDSQNEINYDGNEFGVIYDGSALAEYAGRNCYQSFGRPNEKTATNRGYLHNLLRQRHYSPLEHASVTMDYHGVSRSLTHELVRHRHFSYSQLSQRYVDSADVRFVLPPYIRDLLECNHRLGNFMKGDFEQGCGQALVSYGELVRRAEEAGATRKEARQTARAVLPNATETILTVSANYRSWMEFVTKRDNPAADAEIREMANRTLHHLEIEAPNIFDAESRALWDDSVAQGMAKN